MRKANDSDGGVPETWETSITATTVGESVGEFGGRSRRFLRMLRRFPEVEEEVETKGKSAGEGKDSGNGQRRAERAGYLATRGERVAEERRIRDCRRWGQDSGSVIFSVQWFLN